MENVNKYHSYPHVKDVSEGIYWPEKQALPAFAEPAEILDSVWLGDLEAGEKLLFTTLEGLINKKKPRIFLTPEKPGEGKDTWPESLALKRNMYTLENKYELLKKYLSEVDGMVLYDRSIDSHYVNLASTAAGIKNALPVDVSMTAELEKNGIKLKICEDLTGLPYRGAIDIYNYMYEAYWPQCTKRLIVSASPYTEHFIRDMAAAAGAAVIWTENREKDDKAVFCKYLADMEPGNSIVIGWYTEERSGIGAAAEYGLSTIPADFYDNSTVYAGMKHRIMIPPVPKKPELENKIYICIYLSDGDNVQYNQHAMRVLWDNENRGSVPINWTISPGLVDFGPGIFNYFYSTATENDCFVSGPSGIGYSLLVDRHNNCINLTDYDRMKAYAEFTQIYLEKSGMRSITIWDEVTDMHMECYEKYCRYLYGCTVEDWNRLPLPIKTTIQNRRIAFIPNRECYAGDIDGIYNRWESAIKEWDGVKPLFLSAQGVSWRMTPENIKALAERLDKLKPGAVEILRADHFFALFNEANNLPYNLCMCPNVKMSSSDVYSKPYAAINGTYTGEIWTADNKGEKWIQIDLGGVYEIGRYVLRHAGLNGLDAALNTKTYELYTSADGTNWKLTDRQENNIEDVSDLDIYPVRARFLKFLILDGGSDGKARIAEIEIYGVKV